MPDFIVRGREWHDDFFASGKDKITSGNDELFGELMKHASLFSEGRKEARKKLKQALLELGPDEVQAVFDESERFYRYFLLYDSLDELYNELPKENYSLLLESKISWMYGPLRTRAMMRHGSTLDRQLFGAVKRVIDECDPIGLAGAPEDEYDGESAYIAEWLKSKKECNIDSAAQGVYEIFVRQFSSTAKQKSVFPVYILIAKELWLEESAASGKETPKLRYKPYVLLTGI